MEGESRGEEGASAKSSVSATELLEQIERIAASSAFRHAYLLQSFLRFINQKTLDGHPEEISETAIGVQVFGRRADFDPSNDTIVRTQAYRLRQKLREYYEGEGDDDDVIVEIPKGHYIPEVTRRRSRLPSQTVEAALPSALGEPQLLVSTPASSPLNAHPLPRSGSRRHRHAVFAVMLVLAGFTAGVVASRLLQRARTSFETPFALQPVWSHFLTADTETVLAFANNQFLVTESGDMLRYRGSATFDRGSVLDPGTLRSAISDPHLRSSLGGLAFEDAYTGTGEVYSVFRLTNLFSKAGARLLPKRSRSLVLDDLKNHNVVFLGWSPALFRELSLPLEFVFEVPSSEPGRLWNGYILDRGPSSKGETRFSVGRDPKTGQILTDYALFSVIPGIAPDRRIMILAGLTTSGTQGAAEFATSQESLAHLLRDLRSSSNDRAASPFFESVLRVGTSRGLDALSIQPILVRSIHSKD